MIYSLVSALQALIKEYINFLVYTLGTADITNYLEYKTATWSIDTANIIFFVYRKQEKCFFFILASIGKVDAQN